MADSLISKSQWRDIVGNKEYYSFGNFLSAAERFTEVGFLAHGNVTARKRELAAFLANCAHETTGFCDIEELNKEAYHTNYNSAYPPQPGRKYYGRGPLQLTHSCNYGAFSEYRFGDKWVLLNDPDKLAEDGELGFESAIWFWMTQPTPNRAAHHNIYRDRCDYVNWGFGRTIMAINGGLEWGTREGGSDEKDKQVTRRIQYYKKFAGILGVRVGEHGEQLDTIGM